MSKSPATIPLIPTDLDPVVGGTRVEGTENGDLIKTGNDNNHIVAGAGNDTILDFGGVDRIEGGAGNDSIASFAGENGYGRLDDVIDGGWGHDTIHAGPGIDIIHSTVPGADQVYGGEGIDTLYWSPFANNTFFDGGRDAPERGGVSDHLILVKPDFYAGGIGNPVITYQIGEQIYTQELTGQGDGFAITSRIPMSGTVTWGESTMTFTNVEKIYMVSEWTYRNDPPR